MTDKPPEIEDAAEAERRFNETLGRLVNTPHKPHAPPPPKVKTRRSKKE